MLHRHHTDIFELLLAESRITTQLCSFSYFKVAHTNMTLVT